VPPSWRYALQLAQEAANAPPVHPVHTPVGGGWASVADLLFVQSAPTEAPRAMQSGVAPLPAGLTPAAAVRGGGALGAGQAVQPPDGVDGGMRVELPRPGEGLAADALGGRAAWRLEPSADALAAVSATPLSASLPARGACVVLTPHALVRLTRRGATGGAAGGELGGAGAILFPSFLHPLLTQPLTLTLSPNPNPNPNPHPTPPTPHPTPQPQPQPQSGEAPPSPASREWPLSLLLLQDDTQLQLCASGRFWYAWPPPCAAADDDDGLVEACEVSRWGVYAVGAVPPTIRCAAASSWPLLAGAAPSAAAAAEVQLCALAACCEQLLCESRRLPAARPAHGFAPEPRGNPSELLPELHADLMLAEEEATEI